MKKIMVEVMNTETNTVELVEFPDLSDYAETHYDLREYCDIIEVYYANNNNKLEEQK